LEEERILIAPDRPQKPVTDAVLETERLQLRRLTLDDAAFLIDVFGDPAFKRFVGDRKIRTIDQARDFIEKGPFDSYRRFGFGHYVVALKGSGRPIGICGYVKRDSLPDVDIGFSLLPPFRSQGYAFEAASAVMAYGRDTLGFRRIVAIASPDNEASIRLLGRLGLSFEARVRLNPAAEELNLYAWKEA
jgi:RimJ/RimL family protein N-acetyltransferase